MMPGRICKLSHKGKSYIINFIISTTHTYIFVTGIQEPSCSFHDIPKRSPESTTFQKCYNIHRQWRISPNRVDDSSTMTLMYPIVINHLTNSVGLFILLLPPLFNLLSSNYQGNCFNKVICEHLHFIKHLMYVFYGKKRSNPHACQCTKITIGIY